MAVRIYNSSPKQKIEIYSELKKNWENDLKTMRAKAEEKRATLDNGRASSEINKRNEEEKLASLQHDIIHCQAKIEKIESQLQLLGKGQPAILEKAQPIISTNKTTFFSVARAPEKTISAEKNIESAQIEEQQRVVSIPAA